jgi:activator of HSP90 ATPase
MMEEPLLTIVTLLPVRPEILFRLWMSSHQHSDFTGSPAVIDAQVGGEFTAFNRYISGKNIVLDPGRRILQSWRTIDFPADAPDSELELLLESYTGGTVLTLIHRKLPADQIDDYRHNWEEHYLKPLKDYIDRSMDAEDFHA